MNGRFVLLDNGFDTTFNKMHDDDDVFTSICSHSYSHLGISCLFGAKTHEILSTVAQISPLQRNMSYSRRMHVVIRLRLQSRCTSQELNSTNPLCLQAPP